MFCSKCGTEFRNGETNCPECGANVTQTVPMQQSAYYAEAVKFTSVGGWIGWWLLTLFLPIVGWIIAICVTKDQSVKNGIVAYIVVGLILTVLLVILAILGVFSAINLSR